MPFLKGPCREKRSSSFPQMCKRDCQLLLLEVLLPRHLTQQGSLKPSKKLNFSLHPPPADPNNTGKRQRELLKSTDVVFFHPIAFLWQQDREWLCLTPRAPDQPEARDSVQNRSLLQEKQCCLKTRLRLKSEISKCIYSRINPLKVALLSRATGSNQRENSAYSYGSFITITSVCAFHSPHNYLHTHTHRVHGSQFKHLKSGNSNAIFTHTVSSEFYFIFYNSYLITYPLLFFLKIVSPQNQEVLVCFFVHI